MLIATAVALAVVTAGVVIAIASLGFGKSDPESSRAAPAPRAAVPARGRVAVAGHPADSGAARVPTLAEQPQSHPSFAIVQVRDGARVPMLASPGGKLVSTLSAHSEFGSPQVLGVVRQRGSWLGVATPLLPDGQLGWVRFDAASLNIYWTRYSVRVLISKRQLELRYGGKVLGRYTVTVGAAGSGTPEGRFAITDALAYDHSPFYGCCALALSGQQEHLPLGWLGGNRIAIHGTPGPVGYAASHGCIRATDRTMRILFRSVPLGTPVFVVA